MWRSQSMINNFLKPAPRYTQPDWSTNNQLVNNRSELQRMSANQINQDLRFARGDATTQIRWATRSTKNTLSCRVEELSLWKSQAADSVTRVDQEVSALEQVKATAEACLQEKALYRQVLRECVALRDGRMAADLVRDHVEAQLNKEVQLAEEIQELIQKKIHVVLDRIRALKDVRTQLMADQRDKNEAMKLNSQCLTFDFQSSNLGYKYQPSSIAKGTLTYEQWKSHCKSLKQGAEKLVLDCSYFRGNLQYKLSELISALETQRSTTEFCLRKRLNELSRAKDALQWERQQVKDSVSDLGREMQRVERQILSSGSEQQLAHTRLDVLLQRANHELCLDQPHIGLLQETNNLSKNTFALKKKFLLSQKTLAAMHRNLSNLEDGLKDKTRSLEIDRKCQETRQRLLKLRGTPLAPANPSDTQLSPLGAFGV